MADLSRVDEFKSTKDLPANVPHLDISADYSPYDSVQVLLHQLKDDVEVQIVLRLPQIFHLDHVLVVSHLVYKEYLPEGSLGIRGIREGVVHLLYSNLLA